MLLAPAPPMLLALLPRTELQLLIPSAAADALEPSPYCCPPPPAPPRLPPAVLGRDDELSEAVEELCDRAIKEELLSLWLAVKACGVCTTSKFVCD